MAPKMSIPLAIILTINILFFNLSTATFSPPPGKCPRDTLKIGACVNALNLVKLKVGSPPVRPCCSLIQDLVGLEAAVCLCTTLKAEVLGIRLRVPLDISLLLNVCNKKAPTGFKCA